MYLQLLKVVTQDNKTRTYQSKSRKIYLSKGQSCLQNQRPKFLSVRTQQSAIIIARCTFVSTFLASRERKNGLEECVEEFEVDCALADMLKAKVGLEKVPGKRNNPIQRNGTKNRNCRRNRWKRRVPRYRRSRSRKRAIHERVSDIHVRCFTWSNVIP